MRILTTGGDGQLGRALRRALQGHEIIAPAESALDVTDAALVRSAVGDARPDAIVHCAALTDTARCEREPELAHAINAAGAEHVARACAAAHARLVAVSTNEVFDGTARDAYLERDVPRPVNVYGASKLAGERLAAAACRDTLIVRTAWLYGEGGDHFPAKVLRAARTRSPLRFVTDEVATPTNAADLAAAIRELLERNAAPGVYHLTNDGDASRYEWAQEILRLAGIDAPVEAITSEDLRASGYEGPRKPPFSILANTRARALGIVMRGWREALADYFARTGGAADG